MSQATAPSVAGQEAAPQAAPPKPVVVAAAAVPGPAGSNFFIVFKDLLAGGVAGAVSRTVVSPLERMKILFQVQDGAADAYRGIVPTLRKIATEEGWRGFFKGNGTNVIRIAPYSAIQFASFSQYKKIALSITGTEYLAPVPSLIAGACAGITSSTMTYPLDIIRTRLSVQTDGRYRSMWHAIAEVYKHEGGVRGLYRGLSPTLLGVAPYVAINFTTYETLRRFFAEQEALKDENHHRDPKSIQPTGLQKFFSGAVAGATAQTFTYPLDLVRRRMQMMGMPDCRYRYSSTLDAFRTIARVEGIRGLFKGMLPNYLKVVPLMGVNFLVYEWCKRLLNP
ncbi:hypothetical protein H696_01987 [Fonticula alba]|uniref:Uncharacterized protein n=1 Tax=Fonticula alba TaxID=691883 RepID=A0A058Z9S4_FONAL|nr:hypothetical protein H696_01987 [Fonticula alba]KCV71039.1 hypothetical protein H696_01987 [Fonticula alba]|eukprot:XP_009494162.1 hypothetical protein H696_01987 [Fonticula alba]